MKKKLILTSFSIIIMGVVGVWKIFGGLSSFGGFYESGSVKNVEMSLVDVIMGKADVVYAEEVDDDVGMGEGEDDVGEDGGDDFVGDDDLDEDLDEDDVGEDDVGEDLELDLEAEEALYIKAVNPGYDEDGISNVGEMIEIRRKSSNIPISLAGTVVGYTNSSGNYSTLYEFPENSWMVGESILLRLASSPGSELASVKYAKEIARTGGLTLIRNGEVKSAVCFRGSTKKMKVTDAEDAEEISCLRVFDKDKKSMVVFDEEAGEYAHVNLGEYEPEYVVGNYVEIEEDFGEGSGGDFGEGSGGGSSGGSSGGEDDEDESGDSGDDDVGDDAETMDGYGGFTGQCLGLEFSEILTYYAEAKTEQFLELHNVTDEEIDLTGCKLTYKKKSYALSGVVAVDGYFVYKPEGFSFTKNPTSFNEISLMDASGEVADVLTYPNGQKKGTAYVFMGYDAEGNEDWRISYKPTPGEANVYQEFRDCEEGKVINPLTGNCVKDTSATGNAVKTCADGYFLNVLTGRCNKLKSTSTSEEKTCAEGYYLNPDTGRCKKIQTNDGADYAVATEEGEYEESSVFVAIAAVGAVVALGVGYLIYEFRNEIGKFVKKVLRR